MADASSVKIWVPALLALAVLLSTGERPRGGEDDMQQRLQGTWLREQAGDGIQSRHLLTLRPDGGFDENVRVRDGAGHVTVFLHEGTWLYDGTNLKRRYTMINGKPPSRLNFPLVAFEIRFPTRNEFVGIDHIHGHRIDYRRVDPETAP
jgi:hypothetical protein